MTISMGLPKIKTVLLAMFVLTVGAVGATASTPSAGSASKAFSLAFQAWSTGHQDQAESMLTKDVLEFPYDQHLAFFDAACTRSRWLIDESRPKLITVGSLFPGSAEGLAAGYILNVDSGTDVVASFNGMEGLVTKYPGDVLLLWMTAVECRQLQKDNVGKPRGAVAVNLGIQLYGLLLTRIHGVGPSMVHQTYGNLLFDMGFPQTAVIQHRIAVKLEPAPYTCQALIMDLDKLRATASNSLVLELS